MSEQNSQRYFFKIGFILVNSSQMVVLFRFSPTQQLPLQFTRKIRLEFIF